MIPSSPRPIPGAILADVADLHRPDFGAAFRSRFADDAAHIVPRKRWELLCLAQAFEERCGGRRPTAMLGLGVGTEALMYHFAHLCSNVVATDLYDEQGHWSESRVAIAQVLAASPFHYPRETLTVRSMDMRTIDYPDASFDVVWSCSSVEHVATLAELVGVFREIHRVLTPGGHALITTEFSLDNPYFLPGVLSLWRECELFAPDLRGLTLDGPIDLAHNDALPGNRATTRRGTHRLTSIDRAGPCGLCFFAGYTRLTPVTLLLRKTGPHFDWPEHLGAPPWYEVFSTGITLFSDRTRAAAAAVSFAAALALAREPGARLHCHRFLVEALTHAGQVVELHKALDAFAEEAFDLPGDDDALDLIAYVAAGQGRYDFAQACWERAHEAPSALPTSRLRIRVNQLRAALEAKGAGPAVARFNTLADAARLEALDFHGFGDPGVRDSAANLATLRNTHGLAPVAILADDSGASPALARPPRRPVTPSTPDFDLSSPPPRPIAYLGGDIALTKTVYGHKMYVDTRSQVGACYLMDGYWEEWVTRRLKDHVRPGMHAVDVGANMGFFTLLLCDLVGPEGHVTAFEPWPRYHDLVRHNLELNGFQKRSSVVNKAVSDSTGRAEFNFESAYGTGSLTGGLRDFIAAHGSAFRGETSNVDTVTLDEFLADAGRPIDFIKIDVDGAEAKVLHGMQRLIAQPRPLTIFCEFTPLILRHDGIDPAALLDEMRRAAFVISEITPTGVRELRPLDALSESDWMELLLVRS
jgi:FkbM family methyltransferase